jgi:acetyl esterase/lipase
VALEPAAQRLIDALASLPEVDMTTVSPEVMRANMKGLFVSEDAPDVPATDTSVAGPAGDVAVRVYEPAGSSAEGPTVVWFHGGGFCVGDLESTDGTCRRLATASGMRVVSVDYRLAPEHPYPAGVDDCWAALRWVGEHAAELGGDPDRIAVAGDSAGGNLAAVMAHLARENGGPALAFQLLWYPVVTADLSLPSHTENAFAPVLDREVIDAFLTWYLPDLEITDPKALPITLAPANAADLSGLPPAYIGTAEHDPLRDDGARYAELLNAAGVPAELSNEPTLVHGYASFSLVIPAAAEATNRGLAALRKALHP